MEPLLNPIIVERSEIFEEKVPVGSRYTRKNNLITDFFTKIEEVNTKTFLESPIPESTLHGGLSNFHVLNFSIGIAMFGTAIITACLAFIVDISSQEIMNLRKYAFNIENTFLGLMVWWLSSLFFVMIAASFGMYVCQAAEGAGIAEIKVFLGGIEMPNFLSGKALIAKVCGLSTALAAGLEIGRAGPFVHLAAIVADRILTIGFLKNLKQNTTYRNQIMAASIAAGVAATFGAPVGGVIFSIEATASFYIVNNLLRAMFCGVVGAITFTILHLPNLTELVEKTDYKEYDLNTDIFIFALIGVFAGVLGAFFVEYGKRLVWYRNRKVIPGLHKRYRYACAVATITAFCVFFIPGLQNSDRKLLNLLFSTKELNDDFKTPGIGGTSSVIPTLGALFFFRLLLSGLGISVNVPAGFFMPVFILGSVLGRFGGEVSGTMGSTTSPGIFAAVGAAAFTASATHTISPAIIVFEITGSIQYLMPMCISCVIAYTIGFSLNTSIYDAFLGLRGLPYLPTFRASKVYNYKAKDMIDTTISAIPFPSTLRAMLDSMKNVTCFTRIPIIDKENYIVADVEIANLKKYLALIYELETSSLSQTAKQDIAREITHPNGEGVIFELDENSRVEVDKFGSNSVDFLSPVLHLNYAPFSVAEHTSLTKVHYLFLMLGLMQVYVTSEGQFLGVISFEFFAKGMR